MYRQRTINCQKQKLLVKELYFRIQKTTQTKRDTYLPLLIHTHSIALVRDNNIILDHSHAHLQLHLGMDILTKNISIVKLRKTTITTRCTIAHFLHSIQTKEIASR